MTKSNSTVANYAVIATYGQFAWFVTREDAEDFIGFQSDPVHFSIVELH